VGARRGVGGETHPRFVRQRVQRQDLRFLDDAEIGQREIAGDAEDLAGAMVLEGVEQGFDEVHGGMSGGRDGVHFPAYPAHDAFKLTGAFAVSCTFCAPIPHSMPTITIDRYDLALLDAVQHHGNATNAVLGATVHLSASQISRRLQRLAEAGIIAGHAALLDAAAIGLGVTAFAHVILERHGKSQSDAFESAATALPEVMDCYSVSGDADYLLRIVAQDLPAFSELMMKRVLRLPGVARITTNIALQKVKQTHVLPLDHLTQPARSRQQIRYSGGSE
jgi:Lrp/AsnC family leucine-responsive transcriptional regulator